MHGCGLLGDDRPTRQLGRAGGGHAGVRLTGCIGDDDYRMVRVLSIAAFAAVLVASSSAVARPFRVQQIPNGNVKSCLNCHLNLQGEHFTDFGSDVKFNALVGGGGIVSQMDVDWSVVAGMDSDHDTFSNGIELGDPGGAWQIGDPSPGATVYNPGDPESHPAGSCGNGVVEPDEDCEEGVEVSTSCGLLGYDGGTVACGPACTLDLAGCAGFEPDGGPPVGGGDGASGGGDEGGGCAMEAGGGAGAAGTAMAAMLALGAVLMRARRTRKRARVSTRPFR